MFEIDFTKGIDSLKFQEYRIKHLILSQKEVEATQNEIKRLKEEKYRKEQELIRKIIEEEPEQGLDIIGGKKDKLKKRRKKRIVNMKFF